MFVKPQPSQAAAAPGISGVSLREIPSPLKNKVQNLTKQC